MLLSVLLLLVGFVALIKSADALVVGASALARKYNVSDLAIGLTVVAFGTSAPEMVVNVLAAINNHQDIVFSNIIGSNIFNVLVILGIAGLITPLVVQSGTVWKEIPLSFFALVVLYLLANNFFAFPNPQLSRWDGALLLLLFVLFLYYVFRQLKNTEDKNLVDAKHVSVAKIAVFIILGLAGLAVGGNLIVTNAVKLAGLLQISEKIIGITIVAIGTSLPELATSVVAALKKNIDIAVGNIIGSNIFNILFVLGVSSMIRPIAYPVSYNSEFYLLGAGTLILFLAMFTGVKQKLDRWEAAVLVAVYIVYVSYLVGGMFF